MAGRNDQLWHDAHDAHLDRAEVAVWSDSDYEVTMVGDVVAISDQDFLVASRVNSSRQSFSFYDPTLRIER
jgi:hypothetical protein